MASDPRETVEQYASTRLPFDRLRAFVMGEVGTPGEAAPEAIDALRRVLDEHPPGPDGECRGCGVDVYEDPILWPCRTVQAITTALEGKA